jgi:hypothetical protein
MSMHLRARRGLLLPAVTVLLAGAALPSSADAGIRARCRKLCKPMVAACVSTTGQSRRACKRVILRACRLEGTEICELDSGTTTTTTPSSPTTTTTTLPEAPGYLDFDVDDINRDASTDPGVYSFLVTIAADADSVPVSLDPTAFYVLDDQDQRYEAHPAVAAADCSAADVVEPNGTVTCSVHFTLPLVVGYDEEGGGEGYGKLFLEVGGYRRAVYFKVHVNGGWGTIS